MSGSAREQASSPHGSQQNQRFPANTELELVSHGEGSVLPFLHPNWRRYAVSDKEGLPSGAQWKWGSRDNRKGLRLSHTPRVPIAARCNSNVGFGYADNGILFAGRHVLVLPRDQAPSYRTRTIRFLRSLARMFTVFAWWDISWWIGVFFTVGSAMFIAGGVVYWLPIAHPSKTYPYDPNVVSGSLSFVGATLFELGGILLVVEAVNANETGCYGWALEQAGEDEKKRLESHRSDTPDQEKGTQLQKNSGFRADRKNCTHIHNKNRVRHAIGKEKHVKAEGQPAPSQDWKWWTSWHEFRTHYVREIGFNANFVLFVGASIFWVTGLLALPGIYSNLPQGVLWGIYWLTYLVGGVCFIVSSLLYMLEAQEKWFKPAPKAVGWWVGVWNMVGSVGWTWAAALGYCSKHWCEYESELALVWAATSFFIASALLVYEAVEKWPVQVEGHKNNGS